MRDPNFGSFFGGAYIYMYMRSFCYFTAYIKEKPNSENTQMSGYPASVLQIASDSEWFPLQPRLSLQAFQDLEFGALTHLPILWKLGGGTRSANAKLLCPSFVNVALPAVVVSSDDLIKTLLQQASV